MGTYDPMPADGVTGWGAWLRPAVAGLDARAPRFSIMDPAYQGPSGPPGAGVAAADDYSINALLADITSGTPGTNGKEKAAYFPGGKDFILLNTVVWPNGVHLKCGPGSAGLVGRPVQFKWNGTAGGTMFDVVSDAAGRVNNTLITEAVFREGTVRPGKWWELGHETLTSGIDWGTTFLRCHFYNADAPAGTGCIDYRFGPTNTGIIGCRFDNWTGAAVRVAVNNAASHVWIDQFTADTVGNGGVFLWLDGTGGGSNKWVNCTVRQGKIELNSAPVGEKTVILCTLDATATQGLQHKLHVTDVTLQPGGGIGTDYSFVKAARTDAVDTRHIYVRMDACHFTPGATGAARIIEGVVDPPNWGTFTGAIPDWEYTPQGFGFASPGSGGYFADYQTQVRYRDLMVGLGAYTDLAGSGGGRGLLKMHNALAVPSANPVGGGYLYVEAGALKYRGTSGTVTTIGPA